jgi:hypothetical protein
MGLCANLIQVLGRNPLTWLLPAPGTVDTRHYYTAPPTFPVVGDNFDLLLSNLP